MRLRDFARSGHPPTLFSAFLYFDVSFMVWVLLGVLGAHVANDFGLTASQKGLLVAIPILGGSLVRIPLGILVDRIGPKRTGIVGQALVMIPLVWAWLGGRHLHDHALAQQGAHVERQRRRDGFAFAGEHLHDRAQRQRAAA